MAVKKADEYQHNNEDNAFVDSNFVRGGRRKVDNRAGLYALVAKADQLQAHVTIVRVLVDEENGNVATEVLLIDAARIDVAAGWQLQAAGTIAPEPRRTPIAFYGQQLVAAPYTGAYPPLAQVFNEEGYLVECQVRINRFDKILEFQFAAPTTGIILF